MTPSMVCLPARFSALAAPLERSSSTALSRFPSVSSRAFLQSIMPAPVFSRSAATSLAVIVAVIVEYQSDRSVLGHGNAAGNTSGGVGWCDASENLPEDYPSDASEPTSAAAPP